MLFNVKVLKESLSSGALKWKLSNLFRSKFMIPCHTPEPILKDQQTPRTIPGGARKLEPNESDRLSSFPPTATNETTVSLRKRKSKTLST